LVAFLISSVSTGLALQNFYYKSFVVDPVGEFVPNQYSNIEVRITITDADVMVYREVHYAVSSDQFAMYTIEIGSGDVEFGDLGLLTISADLRVQIDIKLATNNTWSVVEKKHLLEIITYGETDEWLDAETIGGSGFVYAKQAFSQSIDGSPDFVVVTDDGRVGINTYSPSPSRKLDVRGNAVIGTQGVTPPVPGAFYGLSVENSVNDITKDYYNVNSDLEVTNDFNTTKRFIGFYSSSNLFGTGAYNSENRGIQGQTDFYGSGFLGLGQGVVGIFVNRGSGSTSLAAGVRGGISNYGTGTITTSVDFLTTMKLGTGPITNHIGVLIESGNQGTNNTGLLLGYASNPMPTGNWGIYQDPAATFANRLTGSLGIGLNPVYKLDVTAASNPVRVQGLSNGLSNNTPITIDAGGVMKKATGIKLGNPDTNNDGIDDSDNATAISSGILRFNSTTNKVQVFVSGTGWIDLH
jgi:hypothetical protein